MHIAPPGGGPRPDDTPSRPDPAPSGPEGPGAPKRRKGILGSPPWAVALVVGLFVLALAAERTGLTRRLGLPETRSSAAPVTDETRLMGTWAHVSVVPGRGLRVPAETAIEAAFEAMRAVERDMSAFREDSDISRLMGAKPGEWVEVSPDTWRVIGNALRFHRLSGGAFDITIKPLLDLYSYNKGAVESLPDQAVVDGALERVGADKIRLEREGMRVALAAEGMALDLGAIAKGYAVDRAAAALRDLGATDFLVEAGGEVWMAGEVPLAPNAKQTVGSSGTTNGPGGASGHTHAAKASRPWHAGIRHPRRLYDIVEMIERSDCAIATSGDYEQFFEIDGVRYSHIVDPRTGYPVRGGVVSATIISPRSCMEADALATTVSVLGEEEGRELLSLFAGVEAFLYLLKDDSGLRRLHLKVPEGPVPPDEAAAALRRQAREQSGGGA